MFHSRKAGPDGTILAELQHLHHPIRIGLIGMGAMGKGLLYQTLVTPGMVCVAVADLRLERALACSVEMGVTCRIASTPEQTHDVWKAGELAVCAESGMLAACSGYDVLIEASSAIADAGAYAEVALTSGKHVVMMNSEADLVFGPHLARLARQCGRVYTSCDGDQHGVLQRLVEEIQLWGFDLVLAGNMKGFLDRYSNPTKIVPEADIRKLDYRMATAYTDGTKLCVEMALLANSRGLRTAVPGMLGPRATHVREALQLFDLETLWSKNETPLVDYVLGAQPDGGVFVIGRSQHPYQREMMAYYKMGPGPFFVFHRPYHLCHVEAMRCVAEAFLHGRSLLEPRCGFQTNVYAYAKRDLHAGEVLDGVGGYACYGLIENCDAEGQHPGLPICLSHEIRLQRDISKDSAILLPDVAVPRGRVDFEMFARAQMVAEAAA